MDVFGEVTPAMSSAPPDYPPSPPQSPPEPVYEEPVFDKVDTESWDSNWDEGWGETIAVYATSDPTYVPEAVQDDVEWEGNSENVSHSDEVTDNLPSEAALKRMKKAELVEMAKENDLDSSGTKADIIARLLA